MNIAKIAENDNSVDTYLGNIFMTDVVNLLKTQGDPEIKIATLDALTFIAVKDSNRQVFNNFDVLAWLRQTV